MSQPKFKPVRAPRAALKTVPAPARPSFTVQVGEAVAALEPLSRIAGIAMPSAREAFAVARLFGSLRADPDVQGGEAARLAMFSKYGEKKDGKLHVGADKLPLLIAEYRPIAERKIEFLLAKLPLSILDSIGPVSPAEMLALQPFLETE